MKYTKRELRKRELQEKLADKNLEGLPKKTIKSVTDEAKRLLNNNISYCNSFICNCLKEYPNAIYLINTELINQKGIQPGMINECVVAAQLAKALELNESRPIGAAIGRTIKNGVPPKVASIIKKHGDPSECRYAFFSQKQKDVILLQYGFAKHKGDIDLYYKGEIFKFEVKESLAKAGEYDLEVNENGEFHSSENIATNQPTLDKIINSLCTEGTNLLKNVGKNIPLNFDYELLLQALEEYLVFNNIDYLVMPKYRTTKLCIIPAKKIRSLNGLFDFKGSEIRTTGRNPMQPTCTNFLLSLLNLSSAPGPEEIVTLNPSLCIGKKARGKSFISRISLGNIFYIKKDKTWSDDEGKILTKYASIKQSKPTISLHIRLPLTAEDYKSLLVN